MAHIGALISNEKAELTLRISNEIARRIKGFVFNNEKEKMKTLKNMTRVLVNDSMIIRPENIMLELINDTTYRFLTYIPTEGVEEVVAKIDDITTIDLAQKYMKSLRDKSEIPFVPLEMNEKYKKLKPIIIGIQNKIGKINNTKHNSKLLDRTSKVLNDKNKQIIDESKTISMYEAFSPPTLIEFVAYTYLNEEVVSELAKIANVDDETKALLDQWGIEIREIKKWIADYNDHRNLESKEARVFLYTKLMDELKVLQGKTILPVTEKHKLDFVIQFSENNSTVEIENRIQNVKKDIKTEKIKITKKKNKEAKLLENSESREGKIAFILYHTKLILSGVNTPAEFKSYEKALNLWEDKWINEEFEELENWLKEIKERIEKKGIKNESSNSREQK